MATFGQKIRAKLSLATLRPRPSKPDLEDPPPHRLTDRNLNKKKSLSASLRSLFTGHSVHSTASTTSSPREQSLEARERDPMQTLAPTTTSTPVDSATTAGVVAEAAAAEGGAAGGGAAVEGTAKGGEGGAAAPSTAVPQPTPSKTTARAHTTRALSPGQDQVYPQSHGKFLEEGIARVKSQPQEAFSYPAHGDTDASGSGSGSSPGLKKKSSAIGGEGKTVRFKTKHKVAAAWTAFKNKVAVEVVRLKMA